MEDRLGDTYGGDTFMRRSDPQSGTDGTYWRLLDMPVPVVLTGLWLSGMALLATCVLTLYLLAATLVGA